MTQTLSINGDARVIGARPSRIQALPGHHGYTGKSVESVTCFQASKSRRYAASFASA